ncbi:LuxR C-terminal-related transcriptional regulator [Rhodococcus sp. T2V]|uniref:response regulator transcription factor n=1 Tax=Rhodococcus sp. T2V TaxID=3034164 RepID=UPI0023E34FF4|nr:LuxR C-terminal-related transcriptional regulator [Rhodococcus sp. T2V]MDF3311637.1 LuxR C-terminal-related transcriptional regulator [Rhodococcus sp. T2V]
MNSARAGALTARRSHHERDFVFSPRRFRGAAHRFPTQILTLVARGDSNADIAAALQVSRRTVATNLENIFAKMGTRSRVRAAVHVTRLGLL